MGKKNSLVYPTPEEMLRVLKVARQRSSRGWAMILLAYRHGMRASEVCGLVRHASTWSIVWGILLIIFGMLAVALPFVAAIAFSIAIGWLLILAGLVHIVVAFHSHRAGRLVWRLLVGVAYAFIGVYLLFHPLLGVASLTLVLAALFVVEGIFDLILFFKMRSMRGTTWVLVDGIISLILGLFIYLQWPSSSFWALGILVGVSMIVSGIARVMLSAAVRKAGTALA